MLNENNVTLKIGNPCLTKDRSDLYHAFHAFHAEFKGWPGAEGRDANDYIESFVENPFPTQEWCYYLHGKLIGVGYVDVVPGALSAIYFYYDPDERYRSPGTWNVLSLLEYAKAQSIPKLYLGYYVAGCRSMEYKAGFTPNEVLHPDGCWRLFRS
jgi:arginine-tRNA-protein transferase